MVVGYGFKLSCNNKWMMQKMEIVTCLIDYMGLEYRRPVCWQFPRHELRCIVQKKTAKIANCFWATGLVGVPALQRPPCPASQPITWQCLVPLLLLNVHHITGLHLISPRVLLSSYLCLTSATENYSCTFRLRLNQIWKTILPEKCDKNANKDIYIYKEEKRKKKKVEDK